MIEFNYIKESSANKALKYWGNFIIQSKNVHYVAVIKKNRFLYSLEIGKKKNKSFNINEYLTVNINDLNSKEIKNLYKTAPITLKRAFRVKALKKVNYLKNIKFAIKTRETSKFIVEDPVLKINKDFNENENQNRNRVLQGGIKICNLKMFTGTLGGIFTLKDFPNSYFGISNWHVLAEGVKLGSAIIQPRSLGYRTQQEVKKHQCGNLFWGSLDRKKEAAFVHFNKSNIEFIKSHNSCGYKLSGKIAKPILGELVTKCGSKTGCNGNDRLCGFKTLYSTNAIIKIDDARYSDNPIFENQLLIENFSNSGDSGSLIVNKKKDVIGLLFAGTINNSNFSVANDINNIFNKRFNISQNIKFNNNNLHLNKFELNEFI
ncbi:hypothetical protein [Aquimarina spinulae]|uniref:hypothetical protein n=1 Tax=Aquimarina spinulae TaxID=1192023 RepID=UPI000D54B833|nr:hypothetical protein [Aquimarina spinulae]